MSSGRSTVALRPDFPHPGISRIFLVGVGGEHCERRHGAFRGRTRVDSCWLNESMVSFVSRRYMRGITELNV